ncbi:MAG: alanine racemase [Clostridia bacterium]|nr:alanine racemase [Clostridia bacterium]
MKILEISKDNLKHNIRTIKKKIETESPNVKIYAVVKANGVGLDLIQYANYLIENEIKSLAVATIEEALKLREAKIKEEILMLTPVLDKKELQLLIQNDITLTIGSLDEIKNLNYVVNQLSTEKSNKQTEVNVKVHIKIDTGFGRYGFLYSELVSILSAFKIMDEKIEIEGLYTHFSEARDEKWTRLQYDRFCEVIEFLKNNGYNPKYLHCCASTAFMKYPNMRLNAVRLGSVFQGRTLIKNTGLIKIGRFKTSIIEIKTVPKGYNISYGKTYTTKKETKLAVIPVGYKDGFNQTVKRDNFKFTNNIISILMEIKKLFKDNRLEAKINGKNYKIIGRLGMYHSIIDVTDSEDIKLGDLVTLDITPLQTNDEIRREYI